MTNSDKIRFYFVDHADALSHYLEYYADVKASPEDCIMTSIDKEGMEIEIRDSKDHKVVRVPFDPPLEYDLCFFFIDFYANEIFTGNLRRLESDW